MAPLVIGPIDASRSFHYSPRAARATPAGVDLPRADLAAYAPRPSRPPYDEDAGWRSPTTLEVNPWHKQLPRK
jgi:hypothetical protein